MSAGGKRLAKRSIVGTRICAPFKETGQYNPGLIVGCKNNDVQFFNTSHTGITPNSKYIVRFENTGETREFSESDIIGPGFGSVPTALVQGQKVYCTHNGREIMGHVLAHDGEELIVTIPASPGTNEIAFDVTKKLDEVRLLESRKSARLQDVQDFDFARLADVQDRKRSQQTASIDVPRNNNMSRKRRPSSGSLFQQPMIQDVGPDGEMDACSAALVLMSLSGSPKSPHWAAENVGVISSSWSSSSSGASSWLSANQSVVGSLGAVSSPGELHFNNNSPTPSSSDEGVESDIGDWEEPRRKRTRQIFKCTFPGCTMIKDRCIEIEAHVRCMHLGGKQTSADDHEEEFYYTEVEVSSDLPSSPASFGGSSSLGMAFSPTMSHMDMARPPSEDPEYKLFQQQQLLQHHQRKSPNGNTLMNPKKRASPNGNRLNPKSSPIRKPRGDTKKCRKVYGMERRDAWCTQCKWKKACTRFGD